jgi:MurE/MurF fusion protein
VSVQQLSSAQAAATWLTTKVRGSLRSDSRLVQPGDGFIAWPGARHDARHFVAPALQAGAAACLVEAEGVMAFNFDDERVATLPALKHAAGEVAHAFVGQPTRSLKVLACTGTNGKTSTSWWLAQALTLLGQRCGVVGTLGIGEPGQVHNTGLTTPDPVALHTAFADFAAQGFAACAIEASSIGLAEQRLNGTHIDVALFGNFTQDHLDYHGSMAAYWAAKRALFDWPGLRAAVVNVDDEHGAMLAAELQGKALELWTVALQGDARLRGEQLHYVDGGLAMDVIEGAEQVRLRSRLVGDYNASNLLGVLAALRALGVPLAQAVAVVPQLAPVPGRMQTVSGAQQPTTLVDYAHTPDALEKVLRALQPLATAQGGALWCVFGCGGDRDAGKRPLMGAIAASLAQQVVLTSDNPRSEAPGHILAQILGGISRADGVAVIEDRAEAIAHALKHAAAQDIVLIAGKGHEDYQEVAGVRRPFSDVLVAQALLRQRQGAHA